LPFLTIKFDEENLAGNGSWSIQLLAGYKDAVIPGE